MANIDCNAINYDDSCDCAKEYIELLFSGNWLAIITIYVNYDDSDGLMRGREKSKLNIKA